jgi:hypothetical protein
LYGDIIRELLAELHLPQRGTTTTELVDSIKALLAQRLKFEYTEVQ